MGCLPCREVGAQPCASCPDQTLQGLKALTGQGSFSSFLSLISLELLNFCQLCCQTTDRHYAVFLQGCLGERGTCRRNMRHLTGCRWQMCCNNIFLLLCGKCNELEWLCRLLLSSKLLAVCFLGILSWTIDFSFNLLGFLLFEHRPPIIHTGGRGRSHIQWLSPPFLISMYQCILGRRRINTSLITFEEWKILNSIKLVILIIIF